MTVNKIKLTNPFNEKIDTWVEGNQTAKETIILAHGFGTNKHETANYFDDIVTQLQDRYRIVRFDFSGYGDSEGQARDASYSKHSQDLSMVISYVRQQFGSTISIVAQSMGCFVALWLTPVGIHKTVLTGIPNSDPNYLIDRLQKRIMSKGGTINEQGISIFPRSSGEIQEIGPQFWQDIRATDPVNKLTHYIQQSETLVVHPGEDDIVGSEHMQEYQTIDNLNFVTIPGDHSFTQPSDREVFLNTINQFLST